MLSTTQRALHRAHHGLRYPFSFPAKKCVAERREKTNTPARVVSGDRRCVHDAVKIREERAERADGKEGMGPNRSPS